MPIQNTYMLNLNNYQNAPEIDQPENFGFTLFKEQKQVVYMMKELENQETIEDTLNDNIIEFNKIRLGACLSFGKTIVTLALIKINNTPIKRNWYCVYDQSNASNVNSITAKVIRKNYINTTLIIVSQSVYHQWMQHAKQANLNILGVETTNDFNNLFMTFLNDKNILENYDAIIMIYRHLQYDLPFGANIHLPVNNRKTSINLLAILSLNTEWKRLVIDDFDTINITNDIIVPARITWCISTTTHHNSIKHQGINRLTDLFSVNHKILDIVKEPLLNLLTIRADLDISTKIVPRVKVIVYTFIHGYLMNKVVNNMQYSDEVVERINSGDISGAAAALGITIKCETPGEFLSCILEKNKTSYYESIHTCKRFETILNYLEENGIFVDQYGLTTSLYDFYDRVSSANDEELDNILSSLVLHRNDIQYIESMHARAKGIVTRNSNILDRLKRNIEGGECQKCLLEPAGTRYILKCCDIVLCEECITLHNNSFIYKCPNCISNIERNSVIEVPESITLEQFLDYDINNAIVDIDKYHKEKRTNEDVEEKDPDKHLPPKTRALINIVTGKDVKYKEKNENDSLGLPGVMESDTYIEKNPRKINKYLIFVKWANCANELNDILKERGIQSLILRGQNKTITKIINTFKNSTTVNVMFMYSNSYCAGLNLEFVTHMIFHHTIMDRSITKQLIGRAQRLGRTESLNLIYLRHKGEKYI